MDSWGQSLKATERCQRVLHVRDDISNSARMDLSMAVDGVGEWW
jgi:hypothetical protein